MANSSNTPKGKNVKILLLIIPVLLIVVISVVYGLFRTGRNDGYAPAQPIPFSHKLHAGQYKIECMYCHSGVEKGRHATVPAMNVCMNCHSVVKPDSPHIQKLKEMVNTKKQPFEWVKVHDLPDYVNFNHKRHIAKGIACETCHGEVKQMERVVQAKPMTMQWCLGCHMGSTAPAFLKQNMTAEANHGGKALSEKARKAHAAAFSGVSKESGEPPYGPAEQVLKGPKTVAPTTCYTCHH